MPKSAISSKQKRLKVFSSNFQNKNCLNRIEEECHRLVVKWFPFLFFLSLPTTTALSISFIKGFPYLCPLFSNKEPPPPRPNPSSQFTPGLGKSTAGWGNLPGENLLLPARETLGYTIGEKQYIVSMHNWENRRLLGEIC